MCGTNLFWKILKIIGMVVGGIAIACAFAIVFGYVVMHLWNWIMPDLFGLQTINYWKALGIVILAKILFGSFGHHRGGHCHFEKMRGGKKMRGFRKHHPEISENYEEYTKFWEEKGSDAFNEYLKQKRGCGE